MLITKNETVTIRICIWWRWFNWNIEILNNKNNGKWGRVKREIRMKGWHCKNHIHYSDYKWGGNSLKQVLVIQYTMNRYEYEGINSGVREQTVLSTRFTSIVFESQWTSFALSQLARAKRALVKVFDTRQPDSP